MIFLARSGDGRWLRTGCRTAEAESPDDDVSPPGAAASLASAAGSGGSHAARLGDRHEGEDLRRECGKLIIADD